MSKLQQADALINIWKFLKENWKSGSTGGGIGIMLEVLQKGKEIPWAETYIIFLLGAACFIFLKERIFTKKNGAEEAILEISFVKGVQHILTHKNIESFWGFQDAFPLSTGFKRTHCFINFINPIKKPKITFYAKEGELILQKQLGAKEILLVENDNKMVYGVTLVLDGEIDTNNSKYIISCIQP